VIAPYTSGELFALRVQNGQVGWSDVLSRTGHVTALSQLDDIAGRPVIDRGVVYAISQSGLMAAFSVNTGERLWSRDVGGINTPWAAGDYVYVIPCLGALPHPQGGRSAGFTSCPSMRIREQEGPIIWPGRCWSPTSWSRLVQRLCPGSRL
jgi:outer membrane protein assembly factor BamB